MCRNIRPLFHFQPPSTDEEVRAAAIQFVRKISGMQKPSQANEAVFQRAIDEVFAASRKLIDDLVTSGPPKDRDVEREKARERNKKRFGEQSNRMRAIRPKAAEG